MEPDKEKEEISMIVAEQNEAPIKKSYLRQTLYQIHKNYLKSSGNNVFDFTEKKLYAMFNATKDCVKGMKLLDLLTKYRAGEVAICWQEGKPFYVSIDKDK